MTHTTSKSLFFLSLGRYLLRSGIFRLWMPGGENALVFWWGDTSRCSEKLIDVVLNVVRTLDSAPRESKWKYKLLYNCDLLRGRKVRSFWLSNNISCTLKRDKFYVSLSFSNMQIATSVKNVAKRCLWKCKNTSKFWVSLATFFFNLQNMMVSRKILCPKFGFFYAHQSFCPWIVASQSLTRIYCTHTYSLFPSLMRNTASSHLSQQSCMTTLITHC